MKLVDAHQHLWRLSRGDYAWLTPERRYRPWSLFSVARRWRDAAILGVGPVGGRGLFVETVRFT